MGCPTNTNHSYCKYNITFNQGNYKHSDLGTQDLGDQGPRDPSIRDLRTQRTEDPRIISCYMIQKLNLCCCIKPKLTAVLLP